MLLRITPGEKRIKQLIREFGNIWRFKRYSPNVQSLRSGGYFIESLDGNHQRWIEEKYVEKLTDVT